MLKIGEAAKRFGISNRTLRYWEDSGILKSVRAENGYRYFDDINMARINQIVLLRKLKLSISDIERILLSANSCAALDVLNRHLDNLRHDMAVYDALIVIVEKIIQKMKESQNPALVIFCHEPQSSITDRQNNDAPLIHLLEREFFMSAELLKNVRIVKLPAMTVASYRVQSTSPEEDCSKVFNKFVLENNLHNRNGYRHFGFNNPNPREGSPVYGYEMWVSVPDDFIPTEPLVKKQFRGGLYASISANMNEIGERWKLLFDWCKNSDIYDVDESSQWLEECSMDFETFISDEVSDGEKQLDLLEPVRLI